MAPANEAPKHQVARLMLITRPRRCGGQVSATSIDPSDHSPFIAKVLSARATMKTEKPGDNATIGIISENIAILTASSLRRPVTVGSSPRARGTLGPEIAHRCPLRFFSPRVLLRR